MTVPPVEASAPSRTTEETDTRDLARGAGVNYLGYIARIAPRAAFLILAGRFYGQDGFGIYTFGITVAETGAAVALFGMKRSLFKFMSEASLQGSPLDGPIAHGIALAMSVALAFALLVAGGAGFVTELFGLPGAAGSLRIFAAAIPLIVLSDILLVAIRYTRQMRFEVYARSLAEPITLTAVLLLLYWVGVDHLALALAYTISLGVAAAATVFFFVRVFSIRGCLRAPLHAGELRRLAGFSGPTAAYDFFTMTFDKVDIFLVSYFTPASVVGVYGMARQFSTVTKKIRGGFDRILPPILSESVEAGDLGRADRHLALTARWILTIQALLILFFVAFGGDILGLVGQGFAGGALVLVLLMAGDAVQGSLGIGELPFVYLRPAVNVVFGAVLLGVGIALNVWLIQEMGGEGAALAVLLTVTLVNAARIVASRRAFRIGVIDVKILKPVIAAVPAAGVIAGVGAFLSGSLMRLVVGVPLLLLTYGGALVILGLEAEDQDLIRRILRKQGLHSGSGTSAPRFPDLPPG